MKKNILTKIIYSLAFIFMFAGCKAKKEIIPAPAVSVPVAEPDNSRKNKLNSIKDKDIFFSTLSIRAKADLSINNNSNDVNMNIRIKNNEVIWVSVTALAGLEVARALITPDSVKILNRLDNIYIKKPFSYIYEFTNERINFMTLQSILVGNTIPEFISDSTELKIDGEEARLKSILGSLIYNVQVDQLNKVLLTNLNDEVAGQELTVGYTDFLAVGQQQVPHSVVMNSQAKNKKIRLDLKFSKVEMDASFDLPFRVPDRFLIKN